jgi:hypothetical protein
VEKAKTLTTAEMKELIPEMTVPIITASALRAMHRLERPHPKKPIRPRKLKP